MDRSKFIEDYFSQIWNGGNIAALDRFVTDDYRRYVSPVLPPLSISQQKERMQSILHAFPDIHMEIDEVLEQGDLVCIRVLFTCTHQGMFMGAAPAGKPIKSWALEMLHIKDGKISEHWGGPDIRDMMRQIGE